ncbi:MAG: hypothetical protein WCF12_09125, partial [Propionicimonas sp.]
SRARVHRCDAGLSGWLESPARSHLDQADAWVAGPLRGADVVVPSRGLHYVNSVHGLYLNEDDADLAEVLALAALNSATALSAEISGRAYGGGILKMEPREAAKLLVPSPAMVRQRRTELQDALPEAKRLLGAGRLPEAWRLVDGILFAPGEAMGAEGLDAIREAQSFLSERRRVRARSRTSTRGTA